MSLATLTPPDAREQRLAPSMGETPLLPPGENCPRCDGALGPADIEVAPVRGKYAAGWVAGMLCPHCGLALQLSVTTDAAGRALERRAMTRLEDGVRRRLDSIRRVIGK